jgi:hypothetical protein
VVGLEYDLVARRCGKGCGLISDRAASTCAKVMDFSLRSRVGRSPRRAVGRRAAGGITEFAGGDNANEVDVDGVVSARETVCTAGSVSESTGFPEAAE